jgi:diguanylate cyclase (GGDEF)-like protein
LADLVVQGRVTEVGTLYAQHEDTGQVHYGLYAENWCVMPRLGNRLYLAIDSGPIYDNEGRLIAAVETLRDMTVQKEAQTALERLAHRDGLTGIANRRSFDRTLDAEWRRALRKTKSLTLLMLDVDHFKGYNDSYGHQAGDECLRRVAAAMAQVPVRVSDQVARYGGEEFAVILPDMSLQGASVVAERIRVAVEQLALVNRVSATGWVTVSIGVASMTARPDQTPAQLVAWADAALFEAKRQGRNRVVVHPRDAALPTPRSPQG